MSLTSDIIESGSRPNIYIYIKIINFINIYHVTMARKTTLITPTRIIIISKIIKSYFSI